MNNCANIQAVISTFWPKDKIRILTKMPKIKAQAKSPNKNNAVSQAPADENQNPMTAAETKSTKAINPRDHADDPCPCHPFGNTDRC